MRVLHVTSTFPRVDGDPVGTFVADLVAAERAAGMEVRVVAPDAPGAATAVAGAGVRRFAASGRLAYRGGLLAAARSPGAAAMVAPYLAAMALAVGQECRTWEPDVVHAHWWFPAGLVSLVGKRPVVVTLHGSDVGLAGRPPFARVARVVARRARTVVAVSDALAREAEPLLGQAVGVAPMPVEVTPGLGTTRSGPLLGVGRFSPEKGFADLMDAAAMAGVAVELVGAGPQERALRAAGASVTPPLPRAELHRRMAGAVAVVVPSHREGLGLVALEAILLGTPVIASHAGGLPEVLGYTGPAPQPGGCVVAPGGVLVRPGDVAALAQALAGASELAAPVAVGAERHRPDVVAARHLALYGEALGSGSRSGPAGSVGAP